MGRKKKNDSLDQSELTVTSPAAMAVVDPQITDDYQVSAVSSYREFRQFAQMMIADTLAGRLPVERVIAVRPLVEMVYTSISAESGQGGAGGTPVLDLLIQAKVNSHLIKPAYVEPTLDVTPAEEFQAEEAMETIREVKNGS